MKGTIQELLYIIRANPKQARIAILLDSTIGIVLALVTYIILSTTGITFTTGAILAISAVFFIVGITILGYILIQNSGMIYGASGLGTCDIDDDRATLYDVDMDLEREQQ